MAVKHLVGQLLLPGKIHDALDKLRQVIEDEIFVIRSHRPGGQVDDTAVMAQAIADLGQVGILLAGEDVHEKTSSPQFAAQIADVDVHAAGLLASQRGQGTGMSTDHGDTV